MKILTLLIVLISASPFCLASEPATGPHGGDVVSNETHRFEVKLNPDTDKIEVFTLSGPKRLAPKKMSITLFRDSGSGQTVELKALNLKDPMPKYQGELSMGAGSYVGAELRFEVSLKNFAALKFVPRIPNRNGSR